MRKLLRLSVFTLFTVSVSACDQPTTPITLESEISASHENALATAEVGIYKLNSQGVPVQHIADVTITDDGAKLTVSGEAENIPEVDGRFFSLFYGKGSHQFGTTACLPAPNPKKRLTEAQMFVGNWGVGSSSTDGKLELSSEQIGDSYIPLSEIETMSVRDSEGEGAIAFQPDLIGCGKVVVHP